jgi:hypothetical protein
VLLAGLHDLGEARTVATNVRGMQLISQPHLPEQ